MNLTPRDADAGEQRGGRVVADRVDGAAEIRHVQEHAEDDGEDGEEHELEGEHPPDIALAEIGEAGGIAGEGLVAEDDVGDAAEQAHRADGDDDRRQAEAGDEQAVERAAERARRRGRSATSAGRADAELAPHSPWRSRRAR